MVRDQRATLDAALEHIHDLHRDRDTALYHLTKLVIEHPELDVDQHLTQARLALI